MIKTKDEFIAKYGIKELKILLKAIKTWQTFAADDDIQINRSLYTLYNHQKSLSDVMELTLPEDRLYRGIAVSKDNKLSKLDVGSIFNLEPLKFAESWADYKSALSFATSIEWQKNFGNKTIGLVLYMIKPINYNILLVPEHKTIRWFELLLENFLPEKKQVDERKSENEYLIHSEKIKSLVVKKIILE